MRSKMRALKALVRDPGPQGSGSVRDRIRADLAERGVAPEFCEALSKRLEAQVASFDNPSYSPLLDGVAAAHEVHSETTEALDERLRQLGEIERLMSAFEDELSKLDEVLSVLAAHVERMRTTSPPERVLH
jgi:flagellar motor switch protein FliG